MTSSDPAPAMGLPRLTPAVKRLMLANLVVFVANMLAVGSLGTRGWLALTWSGLWEGYGLGLVRLVTYQFTHSWADPMHLLWNMLTLYFFGTWVEDRIGYRGVFRLYVSGGVAGALLFLLVAWPQGQADVPLVGASGSCYAFLLYAAAMAPHATVFLLFIPVTLWVLAALLVGIGLYSTYVEFATGQSGGVAHGAHLGGAALGFLAQRMGWFQDWVPYERQEGIVRSLRARWTRMVEERRAADAARDQQRLDELLAKVHEKGLGSLTAAERRFLESASKRRRDR
jgi:membrane associated rhomboid family serine protease